MRSTKSLNGSVQCYTHNVERWRGGEMIQRWVSAALLNAEHRLRRLRGVRDMVRLILALDNRSDCFHQPHKAAWNPPLQKLANSKFNSERNIPVLFVANRDKTIGGQSRGKLLESPSGCIGRRVEPWND